MDALNKGFIPPGGLAFDIGAHVGDRTGSFLRLGARVVALEPHPRVFRALRLIQGRAPVVTLLCAAAGAAPGRLELRVNSRNPTVSTLSPDFIAASRDAASWQGQVWDDRIEVPVVTLDQLIARHGLPDFVKIDVEGHELEVLKGLTQPLPALSFEFTTIQREVALACIAHLSAMARYTFNYSLGETQSLVHDTWITAEAMGAEIARLPVEANSGDVFAKRVGYASGQAS
jgi:FkbM family methyltransferase